MKHGDISNITNAYIYIHIDNLLFLEKKRNLNFLGFSIPLKSEREINKSLLFILERIQKRYNFNVVLFSLNYDESDRKWLEEELFVNHAMYNFLEFHSDILSLRHARFLYLFSNNESLVSVLSREGACHFSEIGDKLNV